MADVAYSYPIEGPVMSGKYGGFPRCIFFFAYYHDHASNTHSNGLVERQASLIKEGFKCAREQGDVILARNLVPSIATGIPPMMAMCGRSDLFTPMGRTPQFDEHHEPINIRETAMIESQRNATNLS